MTIFFGSFISGFALMLIPVFIVPEFMARARAKKIFEEGKVLVVEGMPERYHPMPKGGHDEESFYINGVYFHYSDYSRSFGYDNAASLGGVITPGDFYRITYYPDQDPLEHGGHSILKIEIRQ